jgi:serine/threonine-protein kinase
MVMGTAHYIAPEQALGQDAEPASDVYSLAVCGYECLTGHRPFLSENAVTVAMMHIRDLPPPLPPDVPPGVRAVIEATLVKDPRQRYNNGGEFAAAVAAVRAGLPLPTPSGLVNVAYAPIPVNPHNTVGPGSHPMMRPVPPPGMHPMQQHLMQQPLMPRPRRRSQAGWWVLLVVILVALAVAVAVVVVKLVGSGVSGKPTTTEQRPGGLPAITSVPAGGPPDHVAPGQTQSEGPQGMMTTPWTEWNGTQK